MSTSGTKVDIDVFFNLKKFNLFHLVNWENSGFIS